jgi:hypothetical protein
LAQVIILTGSSPVNKSVLSAVHRTLGAYRIASALMQSGYTVQVIDYIQYMTSNEIISCLKKHLGEETLWVGYSSTFFGMRISEEHDHRRMYQMNTENIDIVYDYIRKTSQSKIVFGGAFALDRHYDSRVDYYISGYADNSAINLTDYLSGKIQSLNTRKLDNGSFLIESSSYPEPQMNNIKTNWEHPSFHLLPDEPISLEFARGCIFKCKFCNYPLLGKKKGTYIRDMEEVRDELTKLWEVTGTDTFYITDDTFNDDNDKMENFHKLFTSLPFKPKFSCFLRLDLMDKYPHQTELLLEAGIVGAFFGVETFNIKSGRAIGKGLHPDKVKKRLRIVRDIWEGKVNIGAGLIVGLPYDDITYIQELYDYVTSEDYPIHQTSFNPLWIPDPRHGTNTYSSEFTLNPKIYGYSFDENGRWIHENGMTYDTAINICDWFTNVAQAKNSVRIADFHVVSHLAMGIEINDVLNLTLPQLQNKYDFEKLNNEKINMYKNLVGAL